MKPKNPELIVKEKCDWCQIIEDGKYGSYEIKHKRFVECKKCKGSGNKPITLEYKLEKGEEHPLENVEIEIIIDNGNTK